ncbi:MAG TPA: amino acid adenylation domain-containing protein [Streptosporangiaceae bacterium]|nr:amino acid adenylation domain-containing protein [Streptosporangiaceae bacterium]
MSVWMRVRALAEANPDATAVLGLRRLRYGELTELTTQLANRLALLAPRCGPGDVVALRLPTGEQALVALLAARSIGAAFLPVDITAPEARQEYVIRESGARLVVELGTTGRLVVRRVDTGRAAAVPPDTAYLIFTSGSTGLPKGVLIPESALEERLEGLAKVPGAPAGTVFLALTALSFDISMAELLLPLTVGGAVAFADPDARLDAMAFAAAVERLKPNVLQGTPSFWHLMLGNGWTGVLDAVIWCGGEALTPELARRLRARCVELWNLYGPTEATIWATAWRCDDPGQVSLGGPLPGSACVLIDQAERVVSGAGAEGEIVLGGVGLASGYLDGQRAERFAPLPAWPGAHWYRTGDRARYRDDGSLEFLGRDDAQVKYRGHRIELGEIEANLEQHPDVSQAVVVLCHAADPRHSRLSAAVCTAGKVSSAQLRRWLADRVTPAMVPQSVSVFPSLPRTTSGKLDRPAIRAMLEATVVVA